MDLLVHILIVCTLNICEGVTDDFLFGKFPRDFKWGASTSAYQIEGGWNEDGKGPSIWDVYVQQPGHNIVNDSTGDIACDSYHKYKEDVQLLKQLGANIYRFSISWPRIMPTGSGPTNQKGIDYYRNLIDELKNNSIEPMITLYHNDLPEELQRYGGWLNEEIAQKFAEFARVCYREFGNDVKHWITLNEPWGTAALGYGKAIGAPGVWGPGTNTYIAGHNLIKAHTAAYHIYNDEFKKTQNGQVGITLNINWFEPMDPGSSLDLAAQERGIQFLLGWYANPIFVNGDYPAIMKQMIANKTHEISPGQPSRLPVFTSAEIAKNKGSADFLGLNFYSSWKVTSHVNNCNPPTYDCDSDTVTKPDTSWHGQASPTGLRKMLNWIKWRYDNVTVYITENGMPDSTGTKDDTPRVNYLKYYIDEALKAVKLDGCNLRGYMCWSLMDNFEWTSGYSVKYGIYQVDFSNPQRPRYQKASARFLAQIIKDNGFVNGYSGPGGISSGAVPYNDQFKIYYGKFPTDFAWGVSSAAYKVEGARTVDGNGRNIWDVYSHAGKISNNATGDVSSDEYHHFKEDVQLIKKLGVSQYQFSVSWSRIFPDGTKASINQRGINYYQNLIDELLANKIQPVVTLYYWDLPTTLQDQDGWLNKAIVDKFVEYADVCFKEFGSKVKLWITFNDPLDIADSLNSRNINTSPYIIGRHIILAHAKTYRMYNKLYKKTQKGKLGISIDLAWAEPENPTNTHMVKLAERYMQMRSGWFLSPIFGTGDYPEVMKHQVKWSSHFHYKQNKTRLPAFTPQEKKLIKGSSDFLGIKYMMTVMVKRISFFVGSSTVDKDIGVATYYDEAWLASGMPWLKVAPFGIRKMLNWIKYNYGNPDVYITENGLPDTNGTLEDEHRIHFYRTYINNVLKATNLDGCNIKGYSAMSLMDGFEWYYGYDLKYGFYQVDFKHPARNRTPRASAYWYSLLTHDNGFKPGFSHVGGWGTAPADTNQFYYGSFPDHFMFGAATSATQVEGGWNEDGRGPSIWDVFSAAGKCKRKDTPKIACNSYHKYKEDVAILKNLGVQVYRFSVSWSRVLPDGTLASRNQKGIDYYSNLINELLKNNIKPIVTIYHWDLPQALEDHGGWLNETIVARFQEYAGLLFKEFGDRVNLWITLNEPWVFTVIGYGNGKFAPGLSDKPGTNPYVAAHNAIRAHAAGYHEYHNTYKGKGKIGITLDIDWQEPKNPLNIDDVEASEWAIQTFLGWFAHPIFINGDYPEIMKLKISKISKEQGLKKSRLPEFTAEEKLFINGSSDFFGLNSYSTNLNEKDDPGRAGRNAPDYFKDRGIIQSVDPSWPSSGTDWLKVVPWGLRKMLNWIRNNYGDQEILITENGVSDKTVKMDDVDRVRFLTLYINEVLKAIRLDGINIIGYTVWSLMDNFEWQSGYTERFGLYNVDFNDPARPRQPKQSAELYHAIIQNNGFMRDSRSDPNSARLQHDGQMMYRKFPELFSWGVSVTSNLIAKTNLYYEKGNSTLDVMLLSNGDYKIAEVGWMDASDDLVNLKIIKATHVYLSMSWSMILPNYTVSGESKIVPYYYESVFHTLTKGPGKIDPIVTLFTWDLPYQIQNQYGGWINETTIDLFVDYARVCFKKFGDKVKYWVTFDEPEIMAFKAYESGELPPFHKQKTDSMYIAVHNMIKAHARVYHMYHQEFKHKQKGNVGIALNREWYTPSDPNDPADNDAVWRNLEFDYGWVGDPIFKTGDYPEIMKQRVGTARLPSFSGLEKELNKGSADFVGISHYTTKIVADLPTTDTEHPTYNDDKHTKVTFNRLQDLVRRDEPVINPSGIRRMLLYFTRRYGRIPIFISGNGVSDQTASSNNIDRSEFIKLYTNEILKAITIDNCDVKGYTYSKLIDGYSWKTGTEDNMGLFYSQKLPYFGRRAAKPAVKYFADLATNNGFFSTPITYSSTIAWSKNTQKPSAISASPRLHYISGLLITVIFTYLSCN